MIETICELALRDVINYNPSVFARARVSYNGKAYDCVPKQWFIMPEQAVILSDVESNGPRILSAAEEKIMISCPNDLYNVGDPETSITTIAQASLYDLIV